jgi:PAS domain S-box-containing protein
MIEAIPGAVMIVQDGCYVYTNPAGAHLLGFNSPTEIKGLPVLQTIHPDCHAEIRERMSRTSSGQSNAPMRLRIIRPDGREVVTESASVGLSFAGKPSALVIGTDVTERERTISRLRRLEHDKALILNSTTELIAHLDCDLRILWANAAAGRRPARQRTI